MSVRVDHRRGRRPQLGQQRVVALEVPSRIYDHSITVAHQDITQRSLADAIELNHVGQGRSRGELTGDVHRLPGSHSANDRVRLVAPLAQKRRRFLAGIAVTTNHCDRACGVELQGRDVRRGEDLGIRMCMENELRTECHAATLDLVGCAHIEHLQRFPAVESLGELLGCDLWD